MNVGPLAAWNGGKGGLQLLIAYEFVINLYWFEFAGKGIWLLI